MKAVVEQTPPTCPTTSQQKLISKLFSLSALHIPTQTNAEGFPDKHKALHVLTKELRDRELKDFYTDSIHECFHMIDMDPKRHRDICVYSQSVVTCLAESAKMNCADWDGETVLF